MVTHFQDRLADGPGLFRTWVGLTLLNSWFKRLQLVKEINLLHLGHPNFTLNKLIFGETVSAEVAAKRIVRFSRQECEKLVLRTQILTGKKYGGIWTCLVLIYIGLYSSLRKLIFVGTARHCVVYGHDFRQSVVFVFLFGFCFLFTLAGCQLWQDTVAYLQERLNAFIDAEMSCTQNSQHTQWILTVINHYRTYSHRYVIHSIPIFFKHYRPCVYELFEPSRSLRVLTQLFLFGQLPILFGATSSWQGPVGPWRLAMRPGSQIGHGMSQDAICSSWRPISFEAKAICTLVQVTFAMYDHWFPLEMRQEKFTSNNFWCRCVAWVFFFVVWLLKKPLFKLT